MFGETLLFFALSAGCCRVDPSTLTPHCGRDAPQFRRGEGNRCRMSPASTVRSPRVALTEADSWPGSMHGRPRGVRFTRIHGHRATIDSGQRAVAPDPWQQNRHVRDRPVNGDAGRGVCAVERNNEGRMSDRSEQM